MTDQPAVPEEKCPVCKGSLRKSKNAQGFNYCGKCNSLINSSLPPTPSPSVGELGPYKATKDETHDFYWVEGPGIAHTNVTTLGATAYAVRLNTAYHEGQQALFRKGGLDREKTLAWLREHGYSLLIEIIESGALDVGGEE